jgi:hypothetical protein
MKIVTIVLALLVVVVLSGLIYLRRRMVNTKDKKWAPET